MWREEFKAHPICALLDEMKLKLGLDRAGSAVMEHFPVMDHADELVFNADFGGYMLLFYLNFISINSCMLPVTL